MNSFLLRSLKMKLRRVRFIRQLACRSVLPLILSNFASFGRARGSVVVNAKVRRLIIRGGRVEDDGRVNAFIFDGLTAAGGMIGRSEITKQTQVSLRDLREFSPLPHFAHPRVG